MDFLAKVSKKTGWFDMDLPAWLH